MPKPFRLTLLLLGVWLAAWSWISWPACQDDAFIHLRYADHLLHQHFVTYDGIHRSFGASSLLYIALLAALRSVFLSLNLPRIVSTVCQFSLFALLATVLLRRLRAAPASVSVLALVLIGCLVSPSGVRWLQDGMETSLVLCVVAAFALALDSIADDPTPLQAVLLLVAGFFAELLRIELLLFLALVGLMLLAARWDRTRRLPSAPAWMTAVAPLLGGLLAEALVFHVMGSLLPDTALAKQDPINGWQGTLRSTKNVFLSSFSIGLGLLSVSVFTFVAVIVRRRRLPLATLLANSLFPVTLALAAVREQGVQGIRYFVWSVFFSALWNLLELARTPSADAELPKESSARLLTMGAGVLAVVAVLSSVIEAPLFYRQFEDRKTQLTEFGSEHLDRLHDLPIFAGDIGMIGWYTGSSICDMNGLVNGRAFAAMNYITRTQACADQHVQVAFVSGYQVYALRNALPGVVNWRLCSRVYELRNLRSSDIHYLIADRAVADRVCAAANATPGPMTPIFPEASDGP